MNPEIEIEVLAFWFPLIVQAILVVPALARPRGDHHLSRAILGITGQMGLLGLFFLGSTLPCLEEGCTEYRQSFPFRVLQAGHLTLSYSLLALSLIFQRRA